VAGTPLYAGYNADAVGSISLSGGLQKAWSGEYIGLRGTGSYTQTGGTHTANFLQIASGTGSLGSYSLSAGLLTVTGGEKIGEYGLATFTQSGGTHSVPSGLTLGDYPGSSGAYALSNGLLTASSETIGVSGTGTFNQTAARIQQPAVSMLPESIRLRVVS